MPFNLIISASLYKQPQYYFLVIFMFFPFQCLLTGKLLPQNVWPTWCTGLFIYLLLVIQSSDTWWNSWHATEGKGTVCTSWYIYQSYSKESLSSTQVFIEIIKKVTETPRKVTHHLSSCHLWMTHRILEATHGAGKHCLRKSFSFSVPVVPIVDDI